MKIETSQVPDRTLAGSAVRAAPTRLADRGLASAGSAPVPGNGGPGAGRHLLVIGGGLTGLAAAARAVERGARVTVLEAAPKLGGKVGTERVGGFVLEQGPDTLVAAHPGLGALIRSAGLGDRLLSPEGGGQGAMIMRRGRLLPVPAGMAVMVPQRLRPILTTPVLTVRARARAALEVLIPRREVADESVESFVTRRLGREVYRWLAEPLIGSIHAGPVGELSIESAFGQLHRDEVQYGGLARAVLYRRYAPRIRRLRVRLAGKASPRRGGSGSQPGTSLAPVATPVNGMAELVEALQRRLVKAGVQVHTGVTAQHLAPLGKGYLVATSEGPILADAVLLAVPARPAARLCRGLDSDAATVLSAMPVADAAWVSLAYRAADVQAPSELRNLAVPEAEGRVLRGVTVSSRRYQGRAPQAAVLLKVALRQAPDSDPAAIATARAELADLIRPDAEPLLARVHRFPDGMPRYTVGHAERVRKIRDHLREWPGVTLAGSAFDGAGLPDCVDSATRGVDAALAAVAR